MTATAPTAFRFTVNARTPDTYTARLRATDEPIGLIRKGVGHWTAHPTADTMLDGWYSTRADAALALLVTARRVAEVEAIADAAEPVEDVVASGSPPALVARFADVAREAGVELPAERAPHEHAPFCTRTSVYGHPGACVDEDEPAACEHCRYTVGHTSWCPNRERTVEAPAPEFGSPAWAVSLLPENRERRGATPLRNVRVDDVLWRAASERAGREGRTLSAVIRDLLLGYVHGSGGVGD